MRHGLSFALMVVGLAGAGCNGSTPGGDAGDVATPVDAVDASQDGTSSGAAWSVAFGSGTTPVVILSGTFGSNPPSYSDPAATDPWITNVVPRAFTDMASSGTDTIASSLSLAYGGDTLTITMSASSMVAAGDVPGTAGAALTNATICYGPTTAAHVTFAFSCTGTVNAQAGGNAEATIGVTDGLTQSCGNGSLESDGDPVVNSGWMTPTFTQEAVVTSGRACLDSQMSFSVLASASNVGPTMTGGSATTSGAITVTATPH